MILIRTSVSFFFFFFFTRFVFGQAILPSKNIYSKKKIFRAVFTDIALFSFLQLFLLFYLFISLLATPREKLSSFLRNSPTHSIIINALCRSFKPMLTDSLIMCASWSLGPGQHPVKIERVIIQLQAQRFKTRSFFQWLLRLK